MNQALFPMLILSGGLGTRIQPLTKDLPKALVEINGMPFIDHQLKLLHAKGIRKVIICVGHLGKQIQAYVGNGERFGLDVEFIFDGPKLLGTAGAIKNASQSIDQYFFVINGDSYLTCDYLAVQTAFINSHKKALMTVFKNSGLWDNSNIEYETGIIKRYSKEASDAALQYIDYGLEVFSKEAFAHVPVNTFYDLSQVYQALLNDAQLAAFEVDTRFYENGSFAGIKALENLLN